MDAFSELREHLRGITDILEGLERKSETIDLEVSRQKSRFYKFKCRLWWGHLPDTKTGVCKRCGKKKPVNKTPF